MMMSRDILTSLEHASFMMIRGTPLLLLLLGCLAAHWLSRYIASLFRSFDMLFDSRILPSALSCFSDPRWRSPNHAKRQIYWTLIHHLQKKKKKKKKKKKEEVVVVPHNVVAECGGVQHALAQHRGHPLDLHHMVRAMASRVAKTGGG